MLKEEEKLVSIVKWKQKLILKWLIYLILSSKKKRFH